MILKGKKPRGLHWNSNRNWGSSIRVIHIHKMKERTRGKWGWSYSQCSEPISQLVATERGRSQPTTRGLLSLLGQMLPLPLPCWLSIHYCKFSWKKSRGKRIQAKSLRRTLSAALVNIQWAGIPGDQWGNGRERWGNTSVLSHSPESWDWLHFPT